PLGGPSRRERIESIRSADPGAAVGHAHVGPFADAAEVVLGDDRHATVVQAHVDVVDGLRLHAVLDGVAGHCAAHGAGDRGGVGPPLAVGVALGDLARRDRAHDAADHGAGGVRGVAGAAAVVDPGHDAAAVAVRALRAVAAAVAAARIAGRGAGAAHQRGGGDHGGGAHHADLHQPAPGRHVGDAVGLTVGRPP